jgi:hypothetical protein
MTMHDNIKGTKLQDKNGGNKVKKAKALRQRSMGGKAWRSAPRAVLDKGIENRREGSKPALFARRAKGATPRTATPKRKRTTTTRFIYS